MNYLGLSMQTIKPYVNNSSYFFRQFKTFFPGGDSDMMLPRRYF